MTNDFPKDEFDYVAWNKMEEGFHKISKTQKLRIKIYLNWYFFKQNIKKLFGVKE